MADAVLITMTNPLPGREDEYQDWYANTHIVEMVGAPSVLSAKLHTVTDLRTPTKWRHCALYELKGDPTEAMNQVFAHGKAGNMTPSTAGDTPSRLLAIATPLGARRGDKPADPDNYIFFVLTNPTSGMEEEYNRWYDGQHVDDVFALPGFLGVQRYRLSAAPGAPEPYWGYLAIYEVDRDRAAAAFVELDKVRGTERMAISPSLKREDNEVAVYAPTAAKVKAEVAGAK